jgi:hypothetical protein
VLTVVKSPCGLALSETLDLDTSNNHVYILVLKTQPVNKFIQPNKMLHLLNSETMSRAVQPRDYALLWWWSKTPKTYIFICSKSVPRQIECRRVWKLSCYVH